MPPISLTNETLLEGISYLCTIDHKLAGVVNELGNPPLWSRSQGFPTMIHIILEQQVSIASAKVAFTKLGKAAGELTPERFLEFTGTELREIGFSRQKTKYGRELSTAILNGYLNLSDLNFLDDATARSELMKIKGIGPWTADIYLLVALLRPDIWPTGDLALAKAVQNIYKCSNKPSAEELIVIAERWIPWRAVAARVLWHYYLN